MLEISFRISDVPGKHRTCNTNTLIRILIKLYEHRNPVDDREDPIMVQLYTSVRTWSFGRATESNAISTKAWISGVPGI